jgi:nitroimidazol reductase NimA-like FMN-containing flavoprotein (pyridoxamine 5'-phosphate oxidase superfamily)
MTIHEVPFGLEAIGHHDCLSLLGSASIGRLGFTSRLLPVVMPVNFVLDGETAIICTESGSVLSAAIAHDVACLEIDDHDSVNHEGWSVLATGRLSEVDGPDELERVRHLPLVPWRPMRAPHYVRLPLELLSGRRLRHWSHG